MCADPEYLVKAVTFVAAFFVLIYFMEEVKNVKYHVMSY